MTFTLHMKLFTTLKTIRIKIVLLVSVFSILKKTSQHQIFFSRDVFRIYSEGAKVK